MASRQNYTFDYRSLIRLLGIATFIALAVTSAGAQAVGANRGDTVGSGGRRSIKGQIYLPGGDTKSTQFKVRVENTDSGTLFTVSDQEGQFNFNGLTAGSFSVVVEGTEVWETMRETLYIDPAGGSRVNIIPFYMRRKPSADPAYAGIPKLAIEHYIKGTEAAQKGDSKKAIEQLEKALAIFPEFAQAYTELGKAYLKQGQLDKATDSLSAALRLKPDDPDINQSYGLVLLQKKDFSGAEERFRRALKQKDDLATTHYYLGLSFFNQKRLGEAQQAFERAISLPGGDNIAQAHRFLGGIYWGNGDFVRAAAELEKYLLLSPKAQDAERTRDAIKELRAKEKQGKAGG